jgi:hypothetical protein
MSGQAPVASIELNLEEVRLLAKSVSKTIDSELQKLGRFAEGSRPHTAAKSDLAVLRDVDAEVRGALDTILDAK